MKSTIEIKERLDYLNNEYRKTLPYNTKLELMHKINTLIWVLED